MTENDEALDLLGRPRAIRTLLCLLDSADDTPVSDLLDAIGGSRTTGINRLDEFRDAGLVVKKAGDNRTMYLLTDDGEAVARDLREATRRLEAIVREADDDE